jgi:hypothetical protein
MSTTPSATANGTADANALNFNSAQEAGFTNYQLKTYIQAYYDAPGTYTWTIFDDGDNNGVVSGTDFATNVTVVVAATGASATYTAALSAHNASTVTSSTYGSLLKVALTSGGVAAAPDTAGGVLVTVAGSGKVAHVYNASTAAWVNVDDSTTYILGADNFDGSGMAYFNVTNGITESVAVTLSGTGSMATSLTGGSPVVITTAAEVTSTSTDINAGAATGLVVTATNTSARDGAATANKAGGSVTLATGVLGATAGLFKDSIQVTDTSGTITGKALANYNILVSSGVTGASYGGTFAITTGFSSAVTGQNFTVRHAGETYGMVVTSATAEATTATVTSADVIRSVYGATHSFTVNVDNQFGANMSNIAVSVGIAGRNSTLAVASAITNASGNAVLTYTDASTSTTSLVDTLTFTAASGVTDTASVTYTSLAGLGVSTVLATTTQTSATTGADLTTITPFAIAAGSDGVEAGRQTVTITVKDANAVAIAGVPVTVTVAGAGAAIYSTTQTVYTSATGVATAQVYAWLAPTYGTNYVVTATAGGVSDTVNTYWAQSTAAHTRNFTATTVGRVITVVAKDRLGNPVLGAEFTARITAGDGFFGTGTNIASGSTDATGTLKFVTLESPTTLTVVVQAGNPGSAIYAQTDAPAGNISSAEADDTFTAATAGTATTAETGVGATFAPAGNNTASVTVEPSVTAAEVAADAAAEATDAANAATDAANAAAEAADAATAAAQDAADAVAALATSVEAMVSALRKQITSLTNLVIKIQKKVRA